jgi:hypothetical protein
VATPRGVARDGTSAQAVPYGCEMTDPNAPDDEKLFSVVEAGSDLAGNLGGAGIGLLVGGPPGAVVGAALGPTIKHTALVLYDRLHGRQRVRAGATLQFVAEDVERRHANGQVPRDDGFFEPRDGLRPEADELLEGVLLQAANSYEERKVPLLGRLYAGIAHDPTVSPATGNYLVRLASELTYRQFVALSVFANFDQHSDALINALVNRAEGTFQPDPALLLELDDLGDRRLVGVDVKGRVVALGETIDASGPLSGIKPGYGRLRLTDAGQLLVRLTRADELSAQEQAAWIQQLQGTPRDA